MLQSRDLDGRNGRNADVFGYIKEEGQSPCSSVPCGGVRVVASLDTAPALAPVAIDARTCFSPYESSRMGPHKYFLAEAYSGDKDESRNRKIEQLETLMVFSKQRWIDRTAKDVPDITSIVGVAGLVFAPGLEPRATVLDKACSMVAAHAGPLTRRLVQAGRYFVMVLDKSQMPNTGFQREVAAELKQQGQQLGQQGQQLGQQGQQLGQVLRQLASIAEDVALRSRDRRPGTPPKTRNDVANDIIFTHTSSEARLGRT